MHKVWPVPPIQRSIGGPIMPLALYTQEILRLAWNGVELNLILEACSGVESKHNKVEIRHPMLM